MSPITARKEVEGSPVDGLRVSMAALGPFEPNAWYWFDLRQSGSGGAEVVHHAVMFRTDDRGRPVGGAGQTQVSRGPAEE